MRAVCPKTCKKAMCGLVIQKSHALILNSNYNKYSGLLGQLEEPKWTHNA